MSVAFHRRISEDVPKDAQKTAKRRQLWKESAHSTHLRLFFDEDFEVLVDYSNSQEDPSSTANSTEEVS